MMRNRKKLKSTLDCLYRDYSLDYLNLDPLELVRQYDDPRDQEAAGFIAAMFALGHTDLIRKTVVEILNRMGGSPYSYIFEFNPDENRFPGFTYRFYKEQDLLLLFWWLKQILKKYGSIKSFFLQGYSEEDSHVGAALSRFVKRIRSLQTRPILSRLPEKNSGAGHFLTDPETGSGCKRMNLFLRWMVRRGEPDLGIWPEISASKLIIPLDTHIVRLGRKLGLTRLANPIWNMAEEITGNLKKLDPVDPVKYDFALCTLGKLVRCPDEPGPASCKTCPVFVSCISFKSD